ncbi:MAG: hypothetical protein ACD_29C00416G0003 [uncultured bacterium]|nr:MAG: hypothetical protein ACD_29C00416G0003 [uncultured bacterium]
MKKISYLMSVLFVMLCVYGLFSVILTSHPITSDHEVLTLQPTTQSERTALAKAQNASRQSMQLQERTALIQIVRPEVAQNAVLNTR